MDELQLVDAARAVLGDDTQVLATGIFGLQNTQVAAVVGGMATGAALSTLPGDSPLLDGATTAVAMHTAREVSAAAQGLTVRMLVAVTADAVHVLDWVEPAGPSTRSLLEFDRSTVQVTVRTWGLSRIVTLQDPADGSSIELAGSTAVFSAEAKGDKLVLHLLTEHG
jgi:hypothetical protein